ncbi:MAG: ECF transporter S component [Ruminococcaceae bacterium]|nr:ECF transporter S component [Oscillospiraceae bacterium]
MEKNQRISTKKLTLGAMLTALVVVLQLVGSFIRFGPFSISLVLIPIVVGAAICGPYIGAWLGLAFGTVVLISGDAAFFLQFNAPATILVVLLKGVASGLLAGLVYAVLEKINRYLAVIVAAVVCPLVNTGIFLIGCFLFFQEPVALLAAGAGFTGSVTAYMFVGLAGFNFLFEMGVNLILSPVIVRLLHIRRKSA